MEIPLMQLPPGDSRLVDAIVGQLKSRGIFDKFRKECLSDVDTKPAFLNLRQRVDGQVMKFLDTQTWKADSNKNQLRDGVRKSILDSGILDSGIDAIINQVVNPKIKPFILPHVEDTVYRFLQIEKPLRDNIQDFDISSMPPPMPSTPLDHAPKPFYAHQMPQAYPFHEMPHPPYYAEPPSAVKPNVKIEEPPPEEIKRETPIPLKLFKDEDVSMTTPIDERSLGSEEDTKETVKEFLHTDQTKLEKERLECDRQPMETDVISSEEDDLLMARDSMSPSRASPISVVKMEEDNAVDSFASARAEATSATVCDVVGGVGDLSIQEEGSLAIDTKSNSIISCNQATEEAPSGRPLFDSGSLDSISSNTSGLSSPLATEVSKQAPDTARDEEDSRMTPPTPLVDEAKDSSTYDLPVMMNEARVVAGASPVSGDSCSMTSQITTESQKAEEENPEISKTSPITPEVESSGSLEFKERSKAPSTTTEEGEVSSSSATSSPKEEKKNGKNDSKNKDDHYSHKHKDTHHRRDDGGDDKDKRHRSSEKSKEASSKSSSRHHASHSSHHSSHSSHQSSHSSHKSSHSSHKSSRDKERHHSSRDRRDSKDKKDQSKEKDSKKKADSGVKNEKRVLKDDDMFALHLTNAKKDVVLPRPTTHLKKEPVPIRREAKDARPREKKNEVKEERKIKNDKDHKKEKRSKDVKDIKIKKEVIKSTQIKEEKDRKNEVSGKRKLSDLSSEEDVKPKKRRVELPKEAPKVIKTKRKRLASESSDSDAKPVKYTSDSSNSDMKTIKPKKNGSNLLPLLKKVTIPLVNLSFFAPTVHWDEVKHLFSEESAKWDFEGFGQNEEETAVVVVTTEGEDMSVVQYSDRNKLLEEADSSDEISELESDSEELSDDDFEGFGPADDVDNGLNKYLMQQEEHSSVRLNLFAVPNREYVEVDGATTVFPGRKSKSIIEEIAVRRAKREAEAKAELEDETPTVVLPQTSFRRTASELKKPLKKRKLSDVDAYGRLEEWAKSDVKSVDLDAALLTPDEDRGSAIEKDYGVVSDLPSSSPSSSYVPLSPSSEASSGGASEDHRSIILPKRKTSARIS